MTEAQRLRLVELAVRAGASCYQALDCAREYERYVAWGADHDPGALNTLLPSETSRPCATGHGH
jgi:hypothetical protein